MDRLTKKNSVNNIDEVLREGNISNTGEIVLDMNSTNNFLFSKREDKNISYLDVLNGIDDLWQNP